MAKIPIQVTINGQTHQAEVEPRMLLVHFIREVVGLEEFERVKKCAGSGAPLPKEGPYATRTMVL